MGRELFLRHLFVTKADGQLVHVDEKQNLVLKQKNEIQQSKLKLIAQHRQVQL